MALAQDGAFSAQDAAAVGVFSDELTSLVRRRELFRVRRGAYVLADRFREAGPDEQYRMRVLAVMRSRPTSDRASHHSALALLGVSFFGAPTTLVTAESPRGCHQSRAGLLLHRPTDAPGFRFGAVGCVSAATACVQVAGRYGFEAGVCAMDSALHLQRCSREELESALVDVSGQQRRRVTMAIAFAEPLTESVGESLTRVILSDAGFTFVPQVEVRGRDLFVGRVDFVVEGCVVVEFDGLVKYAGKDGKLALASEKDRESRLVRLGYEVVRIVWAELTDPAAIIARIREAKALALRRRAAMAR